MCSASWGSATMSPSIVTWSCKGSILEGADSISSEAAVLSGSVGIGTSGKGMLCNPRGLVMLGTVVGLLVVAALIVFFLSSSYRVFSKVK